MAALSMVRNMSKVKPSRMAHLSRPDLDARLALFLEVCDTLALPMRG